MKGKNGIQMSQHSRWHKIFKEMKKKCEINNGKDFSQRRFSLALAKMFEQDVNKCKSTIENARITNEE